MAERKKERQGNRVHEIKTKRLKEKVQNEDLRGEMREKREEQSKRKKKKERKFWGF